MQRKTKWALALLCALALGLLCGCGKASPAPEDPGAHLHPDRENWRL